MYKQILIDGILTYLFHPEELDELLKDSNKPKDFFNVFSGIRSAFRKLHI